MAKWMKFPYPDPAYVLDAVGLKKAWERLHKGDCEPWPESTELVEAWTAFHAGRFQDAVEAGLASEDAAGYAVANKAQAIYANYVEKNDKTKIGLFEEVAERAAEHQAADPKAANAYYWQAYALGRYAQGVSIVRALKDGIGGKVRAALEQTIRLAPKHADAHIALGAYHAEIIDKVGAMIGGAMYGANRAEGLRLFQTALKLNPGSAIARIEYANGLVMLEGDKRMKEATKLYEEAAACEAADAMERLDIELARSELED